MSSSRALWGQVVPSLTHPSVRLVQENIPEVVFMELVPIVFGMYTGISELCTFITDRIDQQFIVLIFQQSLECGDDTGTQHLFLLLYCGSHMEMLPHMRHVGLFSVVMYRSANLHS